METNIIYHSDNLTILKTIPDNSIDAIITDSPYGLGKPPDALKVLPAWVEHGYYEVKGKGFMGKQWDAFVPQPILWKECLRVLKPGGYLLSFFGTRTYDWGTMAIRLVGFEIRDCIQWIYGSGLPKSNASLKPANEPICVARKPGANAPLNINDCRIAFNDENDKISTYKTFGEQPSTKNNYGKYDKRVDPFISNDKGRWPSNVIIDETTAKIIDKQSGISQTGGGRKGEDGKRWYIGTSNSMNGARTFPKNATIFFDAERNENYCLSKSYSDIGGSSRFFYVAKASPSERSGSTHPTIKPIKLMEQLVKLYSPERGVVLDPHFGSGTTGVACMRNNRKYIGIDNNEQSIKEATYRLSKELF